MSALLPSGSALCPQTTDAAYKIILREVSGEGRHGGEEMSALLVRGLVVG